MTVPFDQLSVVVQGPVVRDRGPAHNTNLTTEVVASARRALPGAEVVLSTWAGTPVDDLGADVVVHSDDPGPVAYSPSSRTAQGNDNRQIVSTRNGLWAATRPYAAKLRSDTVVENAGWVGYIGAYPARAAGLRVFRERVVGCSHFFLNPRRIISYFHMGDLFLAGLRDDLLTLFDIPLRRPAGPDDPDLSPEQYIWLTALAARGFRFPPARCGRKSFATQRASELSLANNFAVVHPTDLGLLLPRKMYQIAGLNTCYTHEEWLGLYRTLCAPPDRWASARYVWEYCARRLRRQL